MNRNECLEYFQAQQSSTPGHIVFHSGKSGPRLLVISATHGNEPCGVEATVEFHEYLKKNKVLLNGEVHFLIGNPKAYQQDLRYVEWDLNRMFDRGPQEIDQNSVEGKRTRELKDFLTRFSHFDMVMDLHSVSLGDSQMLIYNRDQAEISNFLTRLTPMAMHLNYLQKDIPGLLIDECKQICEKNFAIECGNHNDPRAREVALFHIYRLLRLQGMLGSIQDFEAKEEYVKSDEKVEVYETLYPIVPKEGFQFEVPHYETISFLEEGTLYATAGGKESYRAPSDCYLVMPPQKIRPHDVDAGFLCHKRVIERS